MSLPETRWDAIYVLIDELERRAYQLGRAADTPLPANTYDEAIILLRAAKVALRSALVDLELGQPGAVAVEPVLPIPGLPDALPRPYRSQGRAW